MYITETKLRVRYAETDRMGFSYYGNYATYFEVARVEALRNVGITYLSLEDSGVLLPVVEYSIKFFKPAHYDDELKIKTVIPRIPTVRIRFEYETWRQDELLNQAWTELVFVNRLTSKPLRCPVDVELNLRPYFET